MFITLISYVLAILIEKNNKHKKAIIMLGVCTCLLGLGIFKYSNFFIDSINALFELNIPLLKIIVPIGISFYTFSAIGYMVDVYREDYKAEKNFVYVALFFAFFPKIISGPLMGAKEFINQLKDYKGLNIKNLEKGIQVFTIGLFKKIVLADHLSVFVNDVYNAPIAFSSFTIVLAVVSYSLQLYLDFSGYSDMAIGIAKILGIDLCENFNLPYISMNLTEFWKRWHISLSSWLQNYLYISLGGNRKGKCRTYINLFLVMLIGGIWHGAGWTFIIWGGMHGLGLIAHKAFMNYKIKRFGNKNAGNIVWKIFSVLVTYMFVALCWVFFRAEDINNALMIFKGMFIPQEGIMQMYTWSIVTIIIVMISTMYAVYKSKDEKRINSRYPLLDLSKTSGIITYLVFLGVTILLAYFGNTAFIYGKF